MNSATLQTNGILNYLSTKGICEFSANTNANTTPKKSNIYTCKLEDFISVYFPQGGLIVKKSELGIRVNAGDELVSLSVPYLWRNFDKAIFNKATAQTPDFMQQSTLAVRSDCDAITISRTLTAIAHEGMGLMKLMTNYQQPFTHCP